jgi:hypothetical protein
MKYLLIVPAALCVLVWAFLVGGLAFWYSLREGVDEVSGMLK